MGLIRLALAMIVVLAHAHADFDPMHAGLAVQAFYIISGFYMSMILSEKYAGSLGLFYSNRLFRLFPTYLIVLGAAAVALLGFDINEYVSRETFLAQVSAGPEGWALIASNITLIGQDIVFWFDFMAPGELAFDPSFRDNGADGRAWSLLLVPQAWSITIEMMFYAIAPFLVRRRWWILVLIAAVSIGLRALGPYLDVSYHLWPRRLFPAELFLFVFGMIAQRALPLIERLPRWPGWLVAALLLALISTHNQLPLDIEVGRWMIYVAFAAGVPFMFHAFKNVTIDKWIGDLSYPVYICHFLVIGVVLHFSPPYALWMILAGVLALSVLLLTLVERPLDRLRQARVRRQAPLAPASAPVNQHPNRPAPAS